MKKSTRKRRASNPRTSPTTSSAPPAILAPFGPDLLGDKLRGMVGGVIQELVAAELAEALQAARYQRPTDAETRRGDRHTQRSRELTTSLGPTTIQLQRARLFDDAGEPTQEWQSTRLPRYARRAPAVDNAILGADLAGTNTRRIRGALRPLLQDGPVSKSAVSRIIQTLKRAFEAWRTSPLTGKQIVFLFLDAIAVKVRSDRRVQTVPVLVAYGVHSNGDKELLAVRLMGSESGAAWPRRGRRRSCNAVSCISCAIWKRMRPSARLMKCAPTFKASPRRRTRNAHAWRMHGLSAAGSDGVRVSSRACKKPATSC